MKKRLLGSILAVSCVLLGAQALAAGNGESLVSVSYLTNTFLPALERLFQDRASQDTQAVYDAALERLDELENQPAEWDGAPEGSGTWYYSETPRVQSFSRGDVVTVSAGSTVFLNAGTVCGTQFVDATAGAELSPGGDLTANHRYLNGQEGDSSAVTVLSDGAQLLLEGYWSVEESAEPATGFTDLVRSRDWYYDAVCWAVEQQLFNGVSAVCFDPGGTMDRSMLATVLCRMEAGPEAAYTGVFSDVPAGQWYTAGVEWAASAGIVNGLGDGRFDPSAPVTREQIASMLYRYAGHYLQLDVSQTGSLASYADGSDVSDWAQEAMAWAVGTGIISGGDGGRLLPGSNASRAQVATMLQRLSSWMDWA